MGSSHQYGGMWMSPCRRDTWVFPVYRDRVHHPLATVPTGEERLGEVNTCRINLTPCRDPGGSPGTLELGHTHQCLCLLQSLSVTPSTVGTWC